MLPVVILGLNLVLTCMVTNIITDCSNCSEFLLHIAAAMESKLNTPGSAQIEAMRQEYIRETLQLIPKQLEEQTLQDCQLLLARYYEAVDKEEKRQSRQPDSEGWVTVSYKKGGAAASATIDSNNDANSEATSQAKANTGAAETEDATRALVFGRGQSRARRQLERQRRREKAAVSELRLALNGANAPKATLAEARRERIGALRASFAEKLRSIVEQRKFRPDG